MKIILESTNEKKMKQILKELQLRCKFDKIDVKFENETSQKEIFETKIIQKRQYKQK